MALRFILLCCVMQLITGAPSLQVEDKESDMVGDIAEDSSMVFESHIVKRSAEPLAEESALQDEDEVEKRSADPAKHHVFKNKAEGLEQIANRHGSADQPENDPCDATGSWCGIIFGNGGNYGK